MVFSIFILALILLYFLKVKCVQLVCLTSIYLEIYPLQVLFKTIMHLWYFKQSYSMPNCKIWSFFKQPYLIRNSKTTNFWSEEFSELKNVLFLVFLFLSIVEQLTKIYIISFWANEIILKK